MTTCEHTFGFEDRCERCGKSGKVIADEEAKERGQTVATTVYRYECNTALKERIAGGANDCPEEREAVKRWVDAQNKPEVQACGSCKRTPVSEPDEWCRDCHCVFGGDKHAPTRPKLPEASSCKINNSWEAWATACDES